MAQILIVDDSKFARTQTRIQLEQLGHDVLESEDGAKGIEIADREAPDLVVLDLLMPNMQGIAVLEELRQRDEPLPVIVMTADPQRQTREQCTSLGAAAVINKYQDPDALADAINQVLGTSEVHQ